MTNPRQPMATSIPSFLSERRRGSAVYRACPQERAYEEPLSQHVAERREHRRRIRPSLLDRGTAASAEDLCQEFRSPGLQEATFDEAPEITLEVTCDDRA
jgi:hypothetical protein